MIEPIAISNGVGKPMEPPSTDELSRPLSSGYRPRLAMPYFFHVASQSPPLRVVIADVPGMMSHAQVVQSMMYYMGGIWPAEFDVVAPDPEIENFVRGDLKRFWEFGLRDVQTSAYTYGWGGYEAVYRVGRNNMLEFDNLVAFSPLDVNPLTVNNDLVGIRVRGSSGHYDLPAAYDTIPAKGMWFVHNKHYDPFWGRTQLYGCWKAWRRLAMPDGAEEIADGAMYRHGYQGPVVFYPHSSTRAVNQPPGQGGRVDNAAIANEMAVNAKAGASFAFPHQTDSHGNRMWEIVWPDRTLNPDGLLAYIKYLKEEITLGINVPPELIQASDTGTGYSGRQIPKEGFFVSQQHNATAMVNFYMRNIGLPLVRRNYGRGAWAEIHVKPLLKSQAEQAAAGLPGAGGGLGQNPLSGLFGAATGAMSGGTGNPQFEGDGSPLGGQGPPDGMLNLSLLVDQLGRVPMTKLTALQDRIKDRHGDGVELLARAIREELGW